MTQLNAEEKKRRKKVLQDRLPMKFKTNEDFLKLDL